MNLGAPVNSPANDFCPTIDRNDHTLFFVSNRVGGCGGADIYVTRHRPDGWDDPHNVGCGVNSAADEASPSPLPEPGNGKVLYFSSVRPGGLAPDAQGETIGDSDLYMSERHDGAYGTPELVPGVNTAFEDGQPNIRRDGREIFFFSNRPGTLGMADIYAATRASTSEPWSTPLNLGPTSTAPPAPRRGRRCPGTAPRSTSARPAPAVTGRRPLRDDTVARLIATWPGCAGCAPRLHAIVTTARRSRSPRRRRLRGDAPRSRFGRRMKVKCG